MIEPITAPTPTKDPTSLRVVVIYVYPNMGGLHDDLAKRFVKHYKQFAPTIPHSLAIVSNGGMPSSAGLDILNGLNYSVLVHDDSGWDIGAYQKAAREIPADLMVFFGGTAFPRGAGWLERMVAAYRKHGPAVYGATASTRKNIHIRTTGFWMDPALLREYPVTVKTQEERAEFEHGPTGMTKWALQRGLKAWMVTWDGEYEWQKWGRIPNGYQNGDQRALLVGDRLTEPPHYPFDRQKVMALAKQNPKPIAPAVPAKQVSAQKWPVVLPMPTGITIESVLKEFGGFRLDTWTAAFEAAKSSNAKRFIETGCFRGTPADGYSTLILACLAASCGGTLDSYELEPKNIATAKKLLAKYRLDRYVTFHAGDSVANLAIRTEPIDFAYLDSYDCGLGPDYSPCQKHHLAEVEAILPILNKRAVVLLDDLLPNGGGKPIMAMKRLEARGFKKLAQGYQVLFASEDTQGWTPYKFAVLTGHLQAYVPLAVSTIYHNKAQYCLKHGYDLRIFRSILPQFHVKGTHGDGISWSRLHQMLELVESGDYEWVWCVGADTLVTNLGITLESLVADTDKHVIITGEAVAPIQADSFLVRSSGEGVQWLKLILEARKKYEKHPWVENQAMIDLLDQYKDVVEILPQWRMNSYEYANFYHLPNHNYRAGLDCYGHRGQWLKGDFLIHWAGLTMKRRMELCSAYEGLVVESIAQNIP